MSELEQKLKAVQWDWAEANERLDKIEHRISILEEITGNILETIARISLNQPEDVEA